MSGSCAPQSDQNPLVLWERASAWEVAVKNSLKGALLSGLLFPGAGQFWLGRRITGTALLLATVAALAAVVSKAAQQAYLILERAESEGAKVG